MIYSLCYAVRSTAENRPMLVIPSKTPGQGEGNMKYLPVKERE